MAQVNSNDYGDGITVTGGSVTPANFYLLGGLYAVGVAATWGGGSVTLNILMPDGTTLLDTLPAAFSANGLAVVYLPPGTYQLTIATATAVVAFVARVPLRQA